MTLRVDDSDDICELGGGGGGGGGGGDYTECSCRTGIENEQESVFVFRP